MVRWQTRDVEVTPMPLVNFMGQLFQVVNGPGTTGQGNFALRRAPPWAGATSADELAAAMTGPQLNALVSMASWAESNLQGVTGVTTLNGKRVPRAAADMASEFRGADFGGRTAREQRQRQKAQRINVSDIEAAARERGTTVMNRSPNGNGNGNR